MFVNLNDHIFYKCLLSIIFWQQNILVICLFRLSVGYITKHRYLGIKLTRTMLLGKGIAYIVLGATEEVSSNFLNMTDLLRYKPIIFKILLLIPRLTIPIDLGPSKYSLPRS